jgi:hypothetical protein
MRFCGSFRALGQLSCPEEGPQADAVARKLVHSALLAIDHADRGSTLETGLAERRDRGQRCAAGGDDVLDQADPLAGDEGAFEPVPRAVVLRLLADDQEGEARRERGRGRQRDGAELRPRQPICVGLVFGDEIREPRAEGLEQVGARLEAVLVEVVRGAAAGAEDEVALEVSVLAYRLAELRRLHAAASRIA